MHIVGYSPTGRYQTAPVTTPPPPPADATTTQQDNNTAPPYPSPAAADYAADQAEQNEASTRTQNRLDAAIAASQRYWEAMANEASEDELNRIWEEDGLGEKWGAVQRSAEHELRLAADGAATPEAADQAIDRKADEIAGRVPTENDDDTVNPDGLMLDSIVNGIDGAQGSRDTVKGESVETRDTNMSRFQVELAQESYDAIRELPHGLRDPSGRELDNAETALDTAKEAFFDALEREITVRAAERSLESARDNVAILGTLASGLRNAEMPDAQNLLDAAEQQLVDAQNGTLDPDVYTEEQLAEATAEVAAAHPELDPAMIEFVASDVAFQSAFEAIDPQDPRLSETERQLAENDPVSLALIHAFGVTVDANAPGLSEAERQLAANDPVLFAMMQVKGIEIGTDDLGIPTASVDGTALTLSDAERQIAETAPATFAMMLVGDIRIDADANGAPVVTVGGERLAIDLSPEQQDAFETDPTALAASVLPHMVLDPALTNAMAASSSHRIDYTAREMETLMEGDSPDLRAAMTLLATNMNAALSPEEREAIWQGAGLPYFNEAAFAEDIAEIVAEPEPGSREEMLADPTKGFDKVGEYMLETLEGAPPEVANEMLDAVMNNFSDSWWESDGTPSAYIDTGAKFYAGLSLAVEGAIRIEPDRAAETAEWLMQHESLFAELAIGEGGMPSRDFSSVRNAVGEGNGLALSQALFSRLQGGDDTYPNDLLMLEEAIAQGTADADGAYADEVRSAQFQDFERNADRIKQDYFDSFLTGDNVTAFQSAEDGPALRNTIGRALGLTPDNTEAASSNDNSVDWYTDQNDVAVINLIMGWIERLDAEEVAAVPLIYVSERDGVQYGAVFRVKGADGEESIINGLVADDLIDIARQEERERGTGESDPARNADGIIDAGEARDLAAEDAALPWQYDSIQNFQDDNHLDEDGTIYLPENLELRGTDGHVDLADIEGIDAAIWTTEEKWKFAGDIAFAVVATAGGIILAIPSGGTSLVATGAVLAGVGAGWGIYRSADQLDTMSAHGQSTDWSNPQARNAYINMFTSGVSVFAVGAAARAVTALRTGTSLLNTASRTGTIATHASGLARLQSAQHAAMVARGSNWIANGTGAPLIADTVFSMVENWDEMNTSARWESLGSIATVAGTMAVATGAGRLARNQADRAAAEEAATQVRRTGGPVSEGALQVDIEGTDRQILTADGVEGPERPGGATEHGDADPAPPRRPTAGGSAEPIVPTIFRSRKPRTAPPDLGATPGVDGGAPPPPIDLTATGAQGGPRGPHLSDLDLITTLYPGRGIELFHARGGIDAASNVLRDKQNIVLVTGFNVDWDTNLGRPLPETDGPPGTALLGRSLNLLGKNVTYVVDSANAPVMRASLEALGQPTDNVIVFDAPGIRATHDTNDATARAEAILDMVNPDAVMAIELPARNAERQYLNMRGVTVKRSFAVGGDGVATEQVINPPLDEIILAANRRDGIETLGVGDGGNEAGLANVGQHIPPALNGRSMTSTVPVDYLVTTSASNWGAEVIGAKMLNDAGRFHDVHTAQEQHEAIAAAARAGAVDGVTRRQEPSVDGFTSRAHQGFHWLYTQALRRRRPRPITIGVFDSSNGGLLAADTIARAVREATGVPVQRVILVDHANAPYGILPMSEVALRTNTGLRALDAALLETPSPDVIVMACNTACVPGTDAIAEGVNTPVLNLIETTADAMVREGGAHPVSLSTTGTRNSHAYANAVGIRDDSITITEIGASSTDPNMDLATLVNRRLHESTDPAHQQIVRNAVERYAAQVPEDATSVWLTCTHYPALKPQLEAALAARFEGSGRPAPEVIDPMRFQAQAVMETLGMQPRPRPGPATFPEDTPSPVVLTSGERNRMFAVASNGDVERADWFSAVNVRRAAQGFMGREDVTVLLVDFGEPGGDLQAIRHAVLQPTLPHHGTLHQFSVPIRRNGEIVGWMPAEYIASRRRLAEFQDMNRNGALTAAYERMLSGFARGDGPDEDGPPPSSPVPPAPGPDGGGGGPAPSGPMNRIMNKVAQYLPWFATNVTLAAVVPPKALAVGNGLGFFIRGLTTAPLALAPDVFTPNTRAGRWLRTAATATFGLNGAYHTSTVGTGVGVPYNPAYAVSDTVSGVQNTHEASSGEAFRPSKFEKYAHMITMNGANVLLMGMYSIPFGPAAWAPNILFGVGAGYLAYRGIGADVAARRHTDQRPAPRATRVALGAIATGLTGFGTHYVLQNALAEEEEPNKP